MYQILWLFLSKILLKQNLFMNIIKLDAIDSTNDFLKEYSRNNSLENFTVVTTLNQINGKGQMGNKWDSENGKNLIMSIYIKDFSNNLENIFDLNVLISNCVLEVLQPYNLPKLKVKWPNDIMADDKKIAGILIENNIKADKLIESIIGIGLNCNQIYFENLPKATSIFNLIHKKIDIEKILNDISDAIKTNSTFFYENKIEFWNKYHQNLYKINEQIDFKDNNNLQFKGIIKKVTQSGFLEVLLENNELKLFNLKQICMV